MTRTIRTLILATTLCSFGLAGCYASGVTRNWGRSYNTNFKHMPANPEAPAELDGPTGLYAATGEAAMARHRANAAAGRTAQDMPSFIQIGTGSN